MACNKVIDVVRFRRAHSRPDASRDRPLDWGSECTEAELDTRQPTPSQGEVMAEERWQRIASIAPLPPFRQALEMLRPRATRMAPLRRPRDCILERFTAGCNG